ncbi:hypothetical protein H5410_017158 [Solanum commersonii]|uniref:Uncharacterized protein n=1 Tax=Solanum commersonii TaxID=4109 RepID=A0A9J5ZYB8_SOLCO|nr:hypothetical protein H5410_017158 [Solanum commersonii]
MNISILLRHSGSWESDIRYERYRSDGIVVGKNISFVNLISTIAAELDIDELKKNIEIRYVVEVPMEPMPDKSDWTAPECVLEEVVLPPRYKKMSDRPRKKRKKNSDEKRSTKTNCCGRCGQEGHNIRTYTFFPKNSR